MRLWARLFVLFALLLGLTISLGDTVSNGVIVADESLVRCVGPCMDPAGGVVASAGTQVYFFDDVVPVGRVPGTGSALPLPPETNLVVAEQPRGLWTARAVLFVARPALKKPVPQSIEPQRVDVRIDPGAVHFVVHVRLPRSDERGRAYVEDGYSLANLLGLLAPLSIDGARVDEFGRDLGRERMLLTRATLVLDVRGTIAQRSAGSSNGEHRIVVGRYAKNPIDLRVVLSDEAFARVNPFERSPTDITGLGEASWRHLKPGDSVVVRVEPTQPTPVSQRARAAARALAASPASPLLSLLAVAWQIAGILATLRLLRVPARRSLVRAAFVFVSACVTSTAGYATVAIGSRISGGAPPLVVIVAAALAIGIVYAVATRDERRAIGTRPAIAIAGMFLLEYVAARYELALFHATPTIEWLGLTFFPLVTFALGGLIGLIAVAPRLIVLAARLRGRVAHAAYALLVAAIALSAAMWKPLAHGDPSHYLLPISLGEPYAAGLEVLLYTSILALPVVGLLAFVCGAGLDRRAPHRAGFAGIVVLLALWCVGLDGPFAAFPPALIALASIPLIALRPRADCEVLSHQTFASDSPADVLFDQAVLRADLAVAARTQRQLREKFLGGDIDLATYNSRSTELATFTSHEARQLQRESIAGAVTTMFTAIPLRHQVRVARQTSVLGALLFGITAFVGFENVKVSLGFATLPELYLGTWMVHWLARGAVAAFAFVLFLPYMRGGTATTKGVFLALAVLVASAPVALLLETSRNAATTLLVAALFFPVIGAVLDSVALVKHAANVSLVRVFSFANLGSIAAIGTVFVGAIASAISGQLSQAAGTFVTSAIRPPPAAVSSLRGTGDPRGRSNSDEQR